MAKQIDDITSLDPHESFEPSGNEIVGNCYQVLVTPDHTDPAVLRGDLAETWEAAEDGLSYRFRLRSDAHFASGSPVTVEDAAFSLQRAVMLDKAPASIISQFGFTRENVGERIRALDDRTRVLRLAEQGAQLPALLPVVRGRRHRGEKGRAGPSKRRPPRQLLAQEEQCRLGSLGGAQLAAGRERGAGN